MGRGVPAVALGVALGLAAVPAARAEDAADPGTDHSGYLARLASAVRARLDAAAATHVARPVPPVPVAIRWKPQKLGSLDLGAPVVAVAAADLDGDGKIDIVAVGRATKNVRIYRNVGAK